MPPATLELVLQGGALGVLVLVLIGLFLLIIRFGPAAITYLNGQTSQASAQTAALVGLTSKVESGHEALVAKVEATSSATHARIDLIEERIGRRVEEAAERVEATVRERASHTTAEVTDELRRLPTGDHPAAVDAPRTAIHPPRPALSR